jgi:hypothetical protein
MQLKRELRANKFKEMQGKSLACPWIPLVEFGLFNTLQRIQIKKSSSAPTRVSACGPEPSQARSPLYSPAARSASGGAKFAGWEEI